MWKVKSMEISKSNEKINSLESDIHGLKAEITSLLTKINEDIKSSVTPHMKTRNMDDSMFKCETMKRIQETLRKVNGIRKQSGDDGHVTGQEAKRFWPLNAIIELQSYKQIFF